MPSRRDHSLDFWLARRQRRRLFAAWFGFWEALAEEPRNQKLAEQHRAKMPPGGLSWPFWQVILNEPIADKPGLVVQLRPRLRKSA